MEESLSSKLGYSAVSGFGEFAHCDTGGSGNVLVSVIAVCTDKQEKGTSLKREAESKPH